ncbi:MAG TPA: glycosyltransferase [Phycisphaerae bacterium]
MDLSIIVPAFNAQATLPECLAALVTQYLPAGRSLEIIVVDDGSSDSTSDLCRRFPVTLLTQKNAGAAAARNTGIARARGHWIAFTDADCIPSRRWAFFLLQAAENARPDALGAVGKTVGHQSRSPAARFVDLSGGLDAQIHLAHPTFPFAPSGNVLYRYSALLDVGGFDARFRSYEAADLHYRLSRLHHGRMIHQPRALVLHRHRDSWAAYWKQQRSYGDGYAQFFIRYPDQVHWSLTRELAAWARLAASVPPALLTSGDAGLFRRGTLLKQCAQRLGFFQTFFNHRETLRFSRTSSLPAIIPDASLI